LSSEKVIIACACFARRPHGHRKQNTATDTAALIIPSVGSNRDRQGFMLANDCVTMAVEVPIWLTENNIAALEAKYRVITFCFLLSGGDKKAGQD
jgi:hypothetical protein